LHDLSHDVKFLTTSYDLRFLADHLVFLTSTGKLLEKPDLLDDGKRINELEELMQKELGIKD
jgi:hypothetical protein